MKSLVKNVLVCSSLLLALSACSNEEKQTHRITANQQMDSQQLADAGEQLMMPQSLHLANKVFEMALAKDPENKKAQFYQAFLERVMIFEGVLTRIQPYVDKYGDTVAYAKNLKEIPNHTVRNFLMTPKDGATTIKSVADIQELLVQYRKAAENFRAFLVKNQDLNLELYINPYLFTNAIEENRLNNCEVTEVDGSYDVKCDSSDIAMVRVNMADIMVLKQAAAGEIAWLSLYTSYSIGSVDDLIKRSEKSQLSSQAVTEAIEGTKDAGILMKSQGLTSIRNLGSDFVVGMKWALKYQNSLCKKDQYGRQIARKGFLTKDICVNTTGETERTIKAFEAALAGSVGTQIVTDDGSKVSTKIDVMAPLDKPVQNLRTVLPATWTADGENATSFRDKTLGGLFPMQDADLLLKTNN